MRWEYKGERRDVADRVIGNANGKDSGKATLSTYVYYAELKLNWRVSFNPSLAFHQPIGMSSGLACRRIAINYVNCFSIDLFTNRLKGNLYSHHPISCLCVSSAIVICSLLT